MTTAVEKEKEKKESKNQLTLKTALKEVLAKSAPVTHEAVVPKIPVTPPPISVPPPTPKPYEIPEEKLRAVLKGET
jgi:hypothetical protein